MSESREYLQIPVETLAALFGVPLITMRKWLSGERKPSGAAKRLIWVVNSALFRPRVLQKLDNWLHWADSSAEAMKNLIDGLLAPVKNLLVTCRPMNCLGFDLLTITRTSP